MSRKILQPYLNRVNFPHTNKRPDKAVRRFIPAVTSAVLTYRLRLDLTLSFSPLRPPQLAPLPFYTLRG